MSLSRKTGRRMTELAALALLAAALFPATSDALITVGSDLSLPAATTSDNCNLSTPPCTHMLIGVRAANLFPARSPTSGVIVSWGIKSGVLSGANDTVTFRLGQLNPASSGSPGSGSVTGDGTGPTVALHEPGIYSFPGPGIPIKAGDFVGVDSTSTRAVSAASTCAFPGSSYSTYHPVLANGGSFQLPEATSICELLVNAVVQPSSVFSFGNVSYKKGTATLRVNVPGPGELSLSGKGVAKQATGRQATVSKTVTEAGVATLKIKPKGKTKKKLAQTGKAKVKVSVTFSPVGGTPNTEKHTIKLKKR
jgi:hypothetical protein